MKSNWNVHIGRLVLTVAVIQVATCTAQSQVLEVGAACNYLSNGITLRYEGRLTKGLSYLAGFRYMINTTSLTANQNADYQNGYAANFGQHFGLSAALAQQIFRAGRFSTSLQLNVLVAHHGILRPLSYTLPGSTTELHDYDYRYPATSVDVTLGLRLTYAVSRKDALSFYSGVGILWSNYAVAGRTFYSHIPSYIYSFPSGVFLDNDDIQVIGISGIPALSLTYSRRLFQKD